jgi:hypothetical protein
MPAPPVLNRFIPVRARDGSHYHYREKPKPWAAVPASCTPVFAQLPIIVPDETVKLDFTDVAAKTRPIGTENSGPEDNRCAPNRSCRRFSRLYN